MLANVAHTPAWRSQGYVCLVCRRQRHLSNRRHQRRFNSEVTQTRLPEPSWADTFNDISDAYSSSKPGKTTKPSKNVEAKASATSSKSTWQKKANSDSRETGIGRLTLQLAKELPGRDQKDATTYRYMPGGTTPDPAVESTSTHRERRKARGKEGRKEVDQATQQDVGSSPLAKSEFRSGKTESPASVNAKFRLIELLKQEIQKKATRLDEELAGQHQASARATDTDYTGTMSSSQAEILEDTWEKSFPASIVRYNNPRSPTSEQALETTGHSANRDGSILWESTAEETSDSWEANEAQDVDLRTKAQNTPTIVVPSARVSDKPMRLVDRYLENKKQTLPWGVPNTSNGVSSTSLSSSAKVMSGKVVVRHIKNTPPDPVVESGTASSTKPDKASFCEAPESIADILVDMKERKGPDQVVTEVDVAGQEKVGQSQEIQLEGHKPPEVEEAPPSRPSTRRAEDPAEQEVQQDDGPGPAHTRLAGLYKHGGPGSTTADNTTTLEAEMAQMQDPEKLDQEEKKDAQPRQRGLGLFPTNILRASLSSEPASPSDVDASGSASAAPDAILGSKAKSAKSLRSKEAPRTSDKDKNDMVDSSTKRDKASQTAESSPEGEAEEREETPASAAIMSIEPDALEIKPLDIPQPPVPFLEYGLDRVLFNPGVYQLQDPASRVYNFDPYLQKIMPVVEFDFDSLKEYKTSSQDEALAKLAKDQDKRYIGSTSSMTSSLAHFHYLLSNWRNVNLDMLTTGFVTKNTNRNFTEINRAPSAIFLRWKNGTYAIDADKEYDGANVLMLLGKSMELLLTLPTSEYERYRKSDPRKVPEAQKIAPESYQYTTMRDFLMRSQLDAYDPRLPGNGTFDLKTRAVVSVRMQSQDFEPMTGYEIYGLHGKWGSYEREYYDMIRSTMLKYMLQARMGRMNGIFVAYHNVKRIFGFQYIPMHDLDRALHGQADTCLGDQEFKASLEIMNELFNKATAKFPEQSLRFHFETQPQKDGGMPTAMHVFAEPMTEEEIDRIQTSQKAKVEEFERNIMGKSDKPVEHASSQNAAASSTSKEVPRENLMSTDSNADESFLKSITSDGLESNLKPLFYATVIVQSKVNGETLRDDRPENLKRDDKWEIDYILKEYEITQHEWALYEDCRARRKYALSEREDEDGADAESDGKSRQEDSSFIKYLKDMAKQGQVFRDRIDGFDAGKEVVRVDQPLPKEREGIEDVEDYMAWMYGSKQSDGP